jgi:hypothetical protein
LKIKLAKWEGVWKTEIYDEDGGKLFPSQEVQVSPLDYLKKGTNVACLIQCSGIYFISGKFGLTWQLVQSIVQKPRESIVGKCYIKINAKEKEKLKNQKVEEDVVDEEEETSNIQVVDSDEEDNDNELYAVGGKEAVAPVMMEVEEPVKEEDTTMFEPEPVALKPAPKKKIVKKSTTNA